MKLIVLIDDMWEGHHPTYFKTFCKTLLELNYQVSGFCPEPQEVKEWLSDNCPELIENVYLSSIQTLAYSKNSISILRPTINTLNRWYIAKIAVEKSIATFKKSPDLVFFSWLDNYSGTKLIINLIPLIINSIFPYNWSGLLFQPLLRREIKFSKFRFGFLNPFFLLKSSYCKGFAVLDEGIIEKLQNKLPNKQIIAFPDFTDESPLDTSYSVVHEVRESAKEKVIIGLLGSLNKRKGLLTMLRVSQEIAHQGYFFLFAGKLDSPSFSEDELKYIESIVSSNPSNCFFYFERIPDENKFNTLINECNVLFVAYENFPNSSNLLTKAAIFKKPVISGKRFCIGERVKKYNLGFTISEGNVPECINVLESIYEELSTDFLSNKSYFEEYGQVNSVERLKKSFQTLLESI